MGAIAAGPSDRLVFSRTSTGCTCLAARLHPPRGGGSAGRGTDLGALREQVAQAWIESEVFGAHTMRLLPKLGGGGDAGADAALQKLFGSEIQQRACELGMQLEGMSSQLFGGPHAVDAGDWQERYLYARSTTISSGTSEVLRSLIAQQALGLPRG